MFDGHTTSTYEITTSLPKHNTTHEQNAGYAKINTAKTEKILENFDVTSFFKHALSLDEDAANVELDKAVSYMLYTAESKRNECPKLKIMIGGEDISAVRQRMWDFDTKWAVAQ